MLRPRYIEARWTLIAYHVHPKIRLGIPNVTLIVESTKNKTKKVVCTSTWPSLIISTRGQGSMCVALTASFLNRGFLQPLTFGIMSDLYKLEILSLVSRINQEIINHTGV